MEAIRKKLNSEAESIEESLPKLSFLDILNDVRYGQARIDDEANEESKAEKQTSLETANEAEEKLKREMEKQHEEYADTKMRCHVLKKFGEIILREGSCPVCSQNIAAELHRDFESTLTIDIDSSSESDHVHEVTDGKFR